MVEDTELRALGGFLIFIIHNSTFIIGRKPWQ